MAEIEFKRRGTPLWVVVLALVVVAGVLYAIFGRGSSTPTSETPPATQTPASGGTATPPTSGAAPPAPATTPVAAFGDWVDGTTLPTDPEQQRAALATGVRLLGDALGERMPMAGAQIVMVRAMADSLAMPGRTANQHVNEVQAAFFGAAYAMREKPAGQRMNQAASGLQLTKPLSEQGAELRRYLEAARDGLRDPDRSTGPRPVVPGAKS